MPKPYASHRNAQRQGVRDPGSPFVDRVEGGRGHRDGVGGRQRPWGAGRAPGRADRVAGLCLDRLGVYEAEGLRGGDDAHIPVLLLGRGDQDADVAGDAGGAHDDVQEGLLGLPVRLITHAGTPS